MRDEAEVGVAERGGEEDEVDQAEAETGAGWGSERMKELEMAAGADAQGGRAGGGDGAESERAGEEEAEDQEDEEDRGAMEVRQSKLFGGDVVLALAPEGFAHKWQDREARAHPHRP